MTNDLQLSQQQRVNSLLAQCQTLARPCVSKVTVLSSDTEEHTFLSALESLYDAMLDLTKEPIDAENQNASMGKFRRSVAEQLISNMNRVITSFYDEIEGPFVDGGSPNDWSGTMSPPTAENFCNQKSNHSERLIDRCLDLCGLGVSLEAAVDYLRYVVRSPASKAASTTQESNETEEEKTNLSAAVTSLRTIRRRLFVTSTNSTREHLAGLVNASQLENKKYLHEILRDNQYSQNVEHIILSMEYYKSLQYTLDDDLLLSDSLVSLVTIAVPALVSSACHSIQISLPAWASRESHGYLLNSAFRVVLFGCTLEQRITTSTDQGVIHIATSTYFRGMMRHAIQNRDTATSAIRLLYQVWKVSADTDGTSKARIMEVQSDLRSHLQHVLSSIPAKREAATFIRAMTRFVVSKHKTQLSEVNASNQIELDAVCKNKVMTILEFFFVNLLANDVDMREAVVDFAVMSPPSSFKIHGIDQSLHVFDKLIPRCVSMLLSLACSSQATKYLEHLSSAAAVWCEEVFVSRTASLQQQYVTEFLRFPLEQRILNQDTIQLGLDEKGTSLASMFIQGISLRLEVSRAESIRRDGMRIAEAMADIFGQSLSFDELHLPQESEERPEVYPESKPGKKSKTKNRKRLMHTPESPLMIDPGAEHASRSRKSETLASESDSECMSDASSWGEDSLEPYKIDDDEEDLRRAPRPRSLRDCIAYLLTNHEDREAYDKHMAALKELPELVSAKPLDLMDVVPTLVRVLLHLEDKFNMDGFLENRWASLMACAVQAPVDTCCKLIDEMKGHVSLGTRMEALSIISSAAEDLAGFTSLREQMHAIKDKDRGDLTQMSTRLRNSLALKDTTESTDVSLQKTRRWRQTRAANPSATNRFNAISAQIILSVFAFLAETKSDEAIWGGSLGERLLSEYLKTLSVIVDCARTYPSTRLFASDLFELAWSFHNAESAEVRRAVLISISTSISVDHIGQVDNISGLLPFLTDVSVNDVDAECREIALQIASSFGNAYPMIT